MFKLIKLQTLSQLETAADKKWIFLLKYDLIKRTSEAFLCFSFRFSLLSIARSTVLHLFYIWPLWWNQRPTVHQSGTIHLCTLVGNTNLYSPDPCCSSGNDCLTDECEWNVLPKAQSTVTLSALRNTGPHSQMSCFTDSSFHRDPTTDRSKPQTCKLHLCKCVILGRTVIVQRHAGLHEFIILDWP